MNTGLHSFLLPAADGQSGQRLCIHHTPEAGAVRAAVLYTHPFAEEMNKARRMAALASRAFAAVGCAVLQIDLRGCGDSSGDFGDASWDDWLADVELGARWLLARHQAPLWLWGLRAGCLLNAEAATRLPGVVQQLLWQPPASGKAVLQQFLRLKLASGLAEGRDETTNDGADDPRRQLAAGKAVEIAGYTLQPALAAGLERAQLQAPPTPAHSIWLETSTREDATLLPATQAAATRWRAAGHAVETEVVRGPAFWQTQEIEDAPALVEATVRAVLASPVHAPLSVLAA